MCPGGDVPNAVSRSASPNACRSDRHTGERDSQVDPQVGELWARCRMGDTDARAALIELYRPLAVVAAKRFRLTSDALDSLEDREAAGTIGLIQAVDRYDPAREVPFEAFAR